MSKEGSVDVRYAVLSFSSAYSFIFLNVLGATLIVSQHVVEDVGFAQVIIAFTTSLFQLLAPRRARSVASPWVGAVNLYEVINILSVAALAYAVAYAFGVSDLVGTTIAIISTFTIFGLISMMRIPRTTPAVVLTLSLIGGLMMTALDLSLLIIFKPLIA